MSWLFFAIMSSAVYAMTNFVDKFLLEKEVKDYRGLVIYTSIIGFIFGSLFWMVFGFLTLPLFDALLVVGSGILTIWGLALYFRALTEEKTSTVIILMQMVPVITLFMSSTFLQEKISTFQLVGFILIFLSTISISLQKEKLKTRLSKALIFMLIADCFWAGSNVLFKFVVSQATFSQLVPYESIGISLGGLMLYILFTEIRNAFHQTQQSGSKKTILFITLNEILFLVAKMLGYFAISLGPVSLVGVVGSTQIFFGIYFGWILTLLIPNTYQEDLSASGIVKQIFFAIIVFGGMWLMQF